MNENYLEHLNSEQREAVTKTEGPLLVIAGAGSGKTRVIEYRTLHLVRSGVSPSSILLLTFTRRAAEEMLARAARWDEACRGVSGGTFHSFAYGIVNRHANRLGFPSFSLLDQGDSEEVVGRCLKTKGFSDVHKQFPRKSALQRMISAARNTERTLDEVVDREYPHFLPFLPEIHELSDAYASHKKEKGYLDYDDLLFYLRALLKDDLVRRLVSSRYTYVMVDEYQDTNAAQGDIVRLLGREHGNVMAVGDDAQSIYGFRGATHENIMRFPEYFPGCVVVTLASNYRSTQRVLDVANAVLENMDMKYDKRLTAARSDCGSPPALFLFDNSSEEAAWIAGRVLDGVSPLREQAVLFRSSSVSIPLQAELAKRGVSFRVFGGLKFYELAHVKDFLAYCRIFVNHRDELSWQRVLAPFPGLGAKACEKIFRAVAACSSLSEVFRDALPPFSLGFPYSGHIRALISFLEAAYLLSSSPSRCSEALLSYYTPLLQAQFDNWHLRLGDLQVIAEMARGHEALGEFLADIILDSPERHLGVSRAQEEEAGDYLTLSTIHSAKGLEWERVFFLGLADGILPSGFAKEPPQLEEEQRLLYVGLTRAKSHLFLSASFDVFGRRGGVYPRLSRFLGRENVSRTLLVEGIPLGRRGAEAPHGRLGRHGERDDGFVGGGVVIW